MEKFFITVEKFYITVESFNNRDRVELLRDHSTEFFSTASIILHESGRMGSGGFRC